MADSNVAEIIEENAPEPVPAPLLGPRAYQALLEKLLSEGKGYGKTKAVAAYELTRLRMVPENHKILPGFPRKGTLQITGPMKGRHDVEVKPCYVVMDMSLYPTEYGRKVMMQETAIAYALRMVGIGDINAPDFKGPGIWTNKKASFEFDYIRREGLNEKGKRTNIYDPNPEAHRLCLPVTEPMQVLMEWGDPYLAREGAMLAIRERDVEGLAAALQSIRDKKSTAFDALYVQKYDKEKEKLYLCARFDVYVQEPGFCEDNYDPVELKENTQKLAAAFTPPRPMPALLRDPSALEPHLEDIIETHTFEQVPENAAMFWSGGLDICVPEDRKNFVGNEEIATSFRRAHEYMKDEDFYTDMGRIVNSWRHKRKSLLSHVIEGKADYLEEREFLRRLSIQFAMAVKGTIHAAVEGARANGNFRMFYFPAIMANHKITHVQAITGYPIPAHAAPYVSTLTREFRRNATFDEWREELDKETKKRTVILIGNTMMFDEFPVTREKQVWAEWQKQDWLDFTTSRLLNLLNKGPGIPTLEVIGTYYSDDAGSDLMIAKARFIAETVFSMREIERIGSLGMSEANKTALEQEKGRLAQCVKIISDYPEVFYFDEPATEAEMARSRLARLSESRRCRFLTQEIGRMALLLDDTLTIAQKNKLWGWYEDYNYYETLVSMKIFPSPEKEGRPREVEDYVRAYIGGLKDQISNHLKMTL